jgi:hypothetical protein
VCHVSLTFGRPRQHAIEDFFYLLFRHGVIIVSGGFRENTGN